MSLTMCSQIRYIHIPILPPDYGSNVVQSAEHFGKDIRLSSVEALSASQTKTTFLFRRFFGRIRVKGR